MTAALGDLILAALATVFFVSVAVAALAVRDCLRREQRKFDEARRLLRARDVTGRVPR